MKLLIWIIILLLVLAIIGMSIWTVYYASLFNQCNNTTSPYCPQYTCTSGLAAVTYEQCVSNGDCAQNLTSPCSIQATKNNNSS